MATQDTNSLSARLQALKEDAEEAMVRARSPQRPASLQYRLIMIDADLPEAEVTKILGSEAVQTARLALTLAVEQHDAARHEYPLGDDVETMIQMAEEAEEAMTAIDAAEEQVDHALSDAYYARHIVLQDRLEELVAVAEKFASGEERDEVLATADRVSAQFPPKVSDLAGVVLRLEALMAP